tara:strand:+ start:2052 stop:2510 length:459 start_codon:yes stop_codon:yes gene_type:complete
MAKPKTKKPSGRPEKYQETFNEQARKLCLMGYTNDQLADFFGVARSTLQLWVKGKAGFSDALKAGKELADMNVTVGLYERACGYSHIETKVFCNQGEITTHDVKKTYPPDPISIKYWLNNRQPEKWREKVDTEAMQPDQVIQKVQIEVVGAS